MTTLHAVPTRAAAPLAALLAALVFPLAPAAAQMGALVAPDGSIDLNRYYTAAETNQIMAEYAVLYPDLIAVEEIGRSYLGAPLMGATLTNRATGPAHEKPALYVDGGLHAAELTGSAVATHLLAYLLQNHGRDARVTRALDEGVFYLRPKFNPDGSDLVLREDQPLRSSVRPVDDDGDGVPDDDPPQDLNGDGWITLMRAPDPDGAWYADPDDDRILRRVPSSGEVPAGARRYTTYSEGIDDDGDGRINEDGIGGLDLNRNFPRNWERIHLQPGAGDFPLSEPETYAAVRFIHDHRNITGIVHGHTSGGFVYRLPSASAPSLFPTDDLALIEHLGAEYTRTTGRPVVPSATHPTEHRYGTLISCGYWDQGVIGWVPEYSPGPEMWVPDYDGDGEISLAEQHRYNDEELGGRYFVDWEPYDHPTLGPIEIGGWKTRFWGQNPPSEHLAEETVLQLPWILYLAEQAPRLALAVTTDPTTSGGEVGIEGRVTNTGFQPTSLTGRGAVGREVGNDGAVTDQLVRPVYLTLEMEGAELVDGQARVNVGHLAGTGPFLPGVAPAEATARWVVRATAPGARVRVVAVSEKSGTVRSEWLPVGGG